MKKIENYIHGKITSTSNNFIHVNDPSTGEVISEVVMSDINDFKNAIVSSKKIQNQNLGIMILSINIQQIMIYSIG